MAHSLGEIGYEAHRQALSYTSGNGRDIRPFRELLKSVERRDVLEVGAWEAAAEAVAKCVRDTMPTQEVQRP